MMREQYERVMRFFAGQENVVTTQSILRMETLLGTSENISFQPKENVQNSSPQTPTEVRLRQNDAFIITDIAIGLKYIPSATPTDVQHANAPIYYNANPSVFSGTAANSAALYNSSFGLIIDNTVYYEFLDLQKMKRVGTSQQGTVSAALAGPVEYEIAQDEKDTPLYAYYPSFPYIGFTGQQNCAPSITLPTSIAFTDNPRTFSVYAVLLFNGWLAANGAQFLNVKYRDGL